MTARRHPHMLAPIIAAGASPSLTAPPPKAPAAVQYIAHECPQAAIRAFIAEARRVLRPGGVIAIVDNNPRSPRLQSMPAAMFTLMKSSGAGVSGRGWGPGRQCLESF
jgi:SAM-dependent methyltransferase